MVSGANILVDKRHRTTSPACYKQSRTFRRWNPPSSNLLDWIERSHEPRIVLVAGESLRHYLRKNGR